MCVSPFVSQPTWPGSTMCPAGKVVPRITSRTCFAISSSLPAPFCTEQTAPSRNAWAVSAMARSVCMLLTATIPKSHGRQLVRARRRLHPPDELAGARDPQPVLVDRRDVRLVQVVGPDLDVVELRERRREQRPDRPAADDADPHRHVPSSHVPGDSPWNRSVATRPQPAHEYAVSRALTRRYMAVCSGTGTPAAPPRERARR